MTILASTSWIIWLTRNEFVFEDIVQRWKVLQKERVRGNLQNEMLRKARELKPSDVLPFDIEGVG
uniref:Uncharacterized protein n=1 Tax=Leersia perrieri TaxID=77586 RepID=A0A0D9W754_9ORYZ